MPPTVRETLHFSDRRLRINAVRAGARRLPRPTDLIISENYHPLMRAPIVANAEDREGVCILQARRIRWSGTELGGYRMARAGQFRFASEQDSPQGSHRFAEARAAFTLFAIAGVGEWNSIGLFDRGTNASC